MESRPPWPEGLNGPKKGTKRHKKGNGRETELKDKMMNKKGATKKLLKELGFTTRYRGWLFNTESRRAHRDHGGGALPLAGADRCGWVRKRVAWLHEYMSGRRGALSGDKAYRVGLRR
jgi:hypothetical protein